MPGQIVIPTTTNSAFIGTDLESRLRQANQGLLLVAGVITNNSVESTVRMAGNPGFDTYLVEDATFTCGRKDWHSRWRTADEAHAMSLANLGGEYCSVIRTGHGARRFVRPALKLPTQSPRRLRHSASPRSNPNPRFTPNPFQESLHFEFR